MCKIPSVCLHIRFLAYSDVERDGIVALEQEGPGGSGAQTECGCSGALHNARG